MAAAANTPWNGTGIGSEFIGIQGNISLRNNKITGFRFKARHTGPLLWVSVHEKSQNYIEAGNTGGTPSAADGDNGNYGYGSGGNIRCRVFANGSGDKPNFSNEIGRSVNRTGIRTLNSEGPDNQVLKFDIFQPGTGVGNVTTSRMSVTAGQLYHVIFENNNLDAMTNFASINWGHCRSTPRSLATKSPWSSFWDKEVVWTGTRPSGAIDSVSDIAAFSVNEGERWQPAFQLGIDPSNGDPNVYFGPINLISNNLLEPQSSTGDTASGSGGVYEITGTQLLRQKFKVPTAMTIEHVRLAPLVYGPSGDTSVMRVNLRRHDGTARGALLASADYTTADASTLRIGTSYSSATNPWTNQISTGGVADSLLIIQRDFGSAVALNTSDTYYLEFVRQSGSSTWLIPVAVDEDVSTSNSPEQTVPCWEGWSPTTTLQGVAQAEWSSNTGGSWVRCSISSASQNSNLEVRARLVK